MKKKKKADPEWVLQKCFLELSRRLLEEGEDEEEEEVTALPEEEEEEEEGEEEEKASSSSVSPHDDDDDHQDQSEDRHHRTAALRKEPSFGLGHYFGSSGTSESELSSSSRSERGGRAIVGLDLGFGLGFGEAYVGEGNMIRKARSLIDFTMPSVLVSVSAFKENSIAFSRFLSAEVSIESGSGGGGGSSSTSALLDQLPLSSSSPSLAIEGGEGREKSRHDGDTVTQLRSLRLFDEMLLDVDDLYDHFVSSEILALLRHRYCSKIDRLLRLLRSLSHIKDCQDGLRSDLDPSMLREAGVDERRRKRRKFRKRRRRTRRRRTKRSMERSSEYVIADINSQASGGGGGGVDSVDPLLIFDDDEEEEDDLVFRLSREADLDHFAEGGGMSRRFDSEKNPELAIFNRLRNLLVCPPGLNAVEARVAAYMLFGEEVDEEEERDHLFALEGFYDLCRHIYEVAVSLNQPRKFILLMEEAFVALRYFLDHVMIVYVSQKRRYLRKIFRHVDDDFEDLEIQPPAPARDPTSEEDDDEWYVSNRPRDRKRRRRRKKKRPQTAVSEDDQAPMSEDEIASREKRSREKKKSLISMLHDEPVPLGSYNLDDVRSSLLKMSRGGDQEEEPISSPSTGSEPDPYASIPPMSATRQEDEQRKLIDRVVKLSSSPDDYHVILSDSLFSSFALQLLRKDLDRGCRIFSNVFGWKRSTAVTLAVDLSDDEVEIVETSLATILRHKLKTPVRTEISRCLANALLLDPLRFIPRAKKAIPRLLKTLKMEATPCDPHLIRLVGCFCISEKMSLALMRREFPLYLRNCMLESIDAQGIAEYAALSMLLLRRIVTELRMQSRNLPRNPMLQIQKRPQVRFVHSLSLQDRRRFRPGQYLTCVENKNYMTNVDGSGVFKIFRVIVHEDMYHLIVVAISLFTDELRILKVLSASRNDSKSLEGLFELREDIAPRDERYRLLSMVQVPNHFVADLLQTTVSKLKRKLSPTEKMTVRIIHKNVLTRKNPEVAESCVRVLENHLPELDLRKPPRFAFTDCRQLLTFPPFKEWFFMFGDLLETGCMPPIVGDIQTTLKNPFERLPNQMPKTVHDYIVEFTETVLPQSQKCRWMLKCLLTFGTLFFHFRKKSDISLILGWSLEELKRRKMLSTIPLVCAMVERSVYLHLYRFNLMTNAGESTEVLRHVFERYGFMRMFKHAFELGRTFVSVFGMPRPDFVDDFVEKLSLQVVNLQHDMKAPPCRALFERLLEAFLEENRGMYEARDLLGVLQGSTDALFSIVRKNWGSLQVDEEQLEQSKSLYDMNAFLGKMMRTRMTGTVPPRNALPQVRPRPVIRQPLPECVVCGEPAPRRCSRCHAVSYCTRACQTKDWRLHQRSCKKHAARLRT